MSFDVKIMKALCMANESELLRRHCDCLSRVSIKNEPFLGSWNFISKVLKGDDACTSPSIFTSHSMNCCALALVDSGSLYMRISILRP